MTLVTLVTDLSDVVMELLLSSVLSEIVFDETLSLKSATALTCKWVT